MTTEEKNAYLAATGEEMLARLQDFSLVAVYRMNKKECYKFSAYEDLLQDATFDAQDDPHDTAAAGQAFLAVSAAAKMMRAYNYPTRALEKFLKNLK